MKLLLRHSGSCRLNRVVGSNGVGSGPGRSGRAGSGPGRSGGGPGRPDIGG